MSVSEDFYADISELPQSIRDCLPEAGQKLYVTVYNRIAREEKDSHKAHFRAIRYFLRGRYVEFVTYPNASSPDPHHDFWLRKCLYCGLVWTESFEFVHAPDCPVQKVNDGLLDEAALFQKTEP